MTSPASKTDVADELKPVPGDTKTTAAAHQAARFSVARVEKIGAPDGAIGHNWYRYVLENGRSSIVGQRSGSLKDVTAYANQYAQQLNSRNGGASSTWTSRNKK